jgi:hypothetical protein
MQGGARSLGVYDGGGDRSQGEGEVLAGFASGSSSSPRCQSNRTNRKYFQDPLTPEREIHSRSLSFPLVGLQKKEKEREKRIGKARVHLAEFKFKI